MPLPMHLCTFYPIHRRDRHPDHARCEGIPCAGRDRQLTTKSDELAYTAPIQFRIDASSCRMIDNSAQILGYRLQKPLAQGVHEEVIAGENSQSEEVLCLLLPSRYLSGTYLRIVLAGHRRDWACKGCLSHVAVSFQQLEVGSQHRREQAHHFSVVQDSQRSAA